MDRSLRNCTVQKRSAGISGAVVDATAGSQTDISLMLLFFQRFPVEVRVQGGCWGCKVPERCPPCELLTQSIAHGSWNDTQVQMRYCPVIAIITIQLSRFRFTGNDKIFLRSPRSLLNWWPSCGSPSRSSGPWPCSPFGTRQRQRLYESQDCKRRRFHDRTRKRQVSTLTLNGTPGSWTRPTVVLSSNTSLDLLVALVDQ